MFTILLQNFLRKITTIFAIFLVLFTQNLRLDAYSESAYDQQKIQIQNSIANIDNKSASLNRDLEDAETYKDSLTEQVASVQGEIDKTEAVVTESKIILSQIDQQINTNKKDLDALVGDMKNLLIEIQKQSNISPLISILSSQNLGEVLSSMYNMTALQDKAENMRIKIDEANIELEKNKVIQENRQKELDNIVFILRSKRSGLKSLLDRYQGKEDQYRSLIKELIQQRAQQEAQISAIEKQKGVSNVKQTTQQLSDYKGCWYEESQVLDIPRDYFSSPTEGSVSRVFANCSHDGADIANSIGTELKAIADGVVYKKGYNSGGYGNYMIIKHTVPSGQRVYALYGHMNTQSFLSTGDLVSKGQLVGYMGNTGNTTGPHVHFMLFSQSLEQTNNESCRNGGSIRSYCYNPAKFINF